MEIEVIEFTEEKSAVLRNNTPLASLLHLILHPTDCTQVCHL